MEIYAENGSYIIFENHPYIKLVECPYCGVNIADQCKINTGGKVHEEGIEGIHVLRIRKGWRSLKVNNEQNN